MLCFRLMQLWDPFVQTIKKFLSFKKTSGYGTFSGDMEMKHWREMSESAFADELFECV